MNTDPALLRAFVEVADTSSFGRAAEALHLDPSTVSRQVGQLERRLGVRLFERTTRQVWLTDAGRALLGDARAVLDSLDAFGRAATAVCRQQDDEVVVGFQVHAINADVLGWVREAEARTASIRVRLDEGNFADPSTGLRDRSADLAFVFLPFDSTGIETAALFELPWLMFLPADHRYARHRQVWLRDLVDEPWGSARTDDTIFRDYWLARDVRGDDAPTLPGSDTPEASLALIATGHAIGPGASARPLLQLDGVVAVPVADPRRTTVALAWVAGGLTPGAARFRDALLAVAGAALAAPRPA
jgi:DNA-binding transcriptional LysR family regulator